MDEKFLEYYNEELAHLRGVAQEFAAEFPKIASRLQLSSFDCEDPYVERLLEGFAFLTARVQKKMNDGFSRFTESILNTVFPIVWGPIPSMSVLKLNPDFSQNSLINGINVPHQTSFKTPSLTENQTPCEFLNAFPVTLWPLEIVDAKYLTKELGAYKIPSEMNAWSAISLKIRNVLNMPFSKLPLDSLPIYLNAPDETATMVLEHLFANQEGLLLLAPDGKEVPLSVPEAKISHYGFDSGHSLLPNIGRRFKGYRLFLEYFTFPARFKFFELKGLRKAIEKCEETELEFLILMNKRNEDFGKELSRDNFELFCTPAINLMKKRADRISYDKSYEYHVVPDRTRPRDYEVYSVESVVGFDQDNNRLFDVDRFYHVTDKTSNHSGNFFTAHRRQRLVPRKGSQRSSYVGGELFISFSGPDFDIYSDQLRQLSLETLCTNRDLPLLIDPKAQLSFMGIGALKSVDFIVNPTSPHDPPAMNDLAWTAISHLRLSYSSLFEHETENPAEIIQKVLKQYCPTHNDFGRQQIEGISSIIGKPVTRRLHYQGQSYFARGLEITVTFDEFAFAGMGCFLLGLILKEFFSHYVTINSFVEVVLRTTQRGEIIRWKPELGTRNVI